MKKLILFSFLAVAVSFPGCKSAEKKMDEGMSDSVMVESNVPEEYRSKSDRDLRREERRREKMSGFFYNR